MNKRQGAETRQRPTTDQENGFAPDLLRQAFAEMESTVEELRVAEEELQAQNEALATAALALDAERERYRNLFHASPEPSLLTDLNGLIQEANPAAAALFGVGPSNLTGKPLAVFVALQSRRTFRTDLLGTPPVDQAAEREQGLWFQPKRGAILYATVRVSAVPGAGATPVGLRWLVRGVIPDPGAELMRYRQLVDEVTDFAIFTLDEQGRITSWNAGAEIIFGFSAREALGRSADMIFTPEDRAAGAPAQEMGTAAAMGRAEDERWHIRKDGTRFWGSGVLKALRDSTGGGLWYAKIVRDATERRLHEQREHAIALQLQAAVQPAAPTSLPGLAVRTFYRPALDEASVGGDFFDVFGLDDGHSVLAVGDVSGKGLEAASQVATVRNVLRAFLYTKPTLAEAVNELNHVLAAHGLLTGFVTLFVGVYDPEARTLAYVNCGQEPALVRRAGTGEVELLSHTGPLLGMNPEAAFIQGQVALASGDVLAVFTDGLTDMGPSRTQMLGEDGVVDLLQNGIAALAGASAQRAAELVTAHLVGAVDALEAKFIPDDVCLLVAVA